MSCCWLISCAAFIPVDVVKERLQVQANRPQRAYHYNGSWDALRSIIRQEGLRGIYKGYWATLFSYGPFSAVYFWIFEEVRPLITVNVCADGCMLAERAPAAVAA